MLNVMVNMAFEGEGRRYSGNMGMDVVHWADGEMTQDTRNAYTHTPTHTHTQGHVPYPVALFAFHHLSQTTSLQTP